jgi:hypothetical protein
MSILSEYMRQRRRVIGERARQLELRRLMTNPTAEIGKMGKRDKRAHLLESARREDERKHEKQLQVVGQARGRWKAAGWLASSGMLAKATATAAGGAATSGKQPQQEQEEQEASASAEASAEAAHAETKEPKDVAVAAAAAAAVAGPEPEPEVAPAEAGP